MTSDLTTKAAEIRAGLVAEQTVAEWRAAMEGVTPGPWRRKAQGGSSTILTATKPPRNDTRIPAYGYRDEGEHCLAYPFIEEGGSVRWDFVSFAHRDAAWVARCSPAGIAPLLDLIAQQAATIAARDDELLGERWHADEAARQRDVAKAALTAAEAERDRLLAVLERIARWERYGGEDSKPLVYPVDIARAALSTAKERGDG